MIARAISYLEVRTDKDITPSAAHISKFSDKSVVSSWAVDGVGTLAANAIMAGTSATTLSPKNSCTVEQSVLLLYRVFEKFQAPLDQEMIGNSRSAAGISAALLFLLFIKN